MQFLILIGLFGVMILSICALELFWMWYPFLAEWRMHRISSNGSQTSVAVMRVSSVTPISRLEGKDHSSEDLSAGKERTTRLAA